MKKFSNVLSSALLESCKEEIASKLNQPVWYSSEGWGHDSLRRGMQGVSTQCLVSTELTQRLEQELKSFLLPCDRLSFQFYNWHKYSGIAMHNDSGHVFGATVYLTEEWHLHWGGLFIWAPRVKPRLVNPLRGRGAARVDPGLNVFCPRYNTLVLNDEKEQHMVTPVSPIAEKSRFTLQIWGHA